MTESTLSLGYADFQRIVGHEIGYGRDTSLWSSNQTSEVDDIIQSGVRQFYFPPPSGDVISHQWSFLKPSTTLTTIVDYNTGTVSSSSTTVTLTGGTWPSWAATNGTLVVSNTDYTIASRTNDTVIELESAPSSAFSSDSYNLRHNAEYDMPDSFGSLDGPIYYPSEEWYSPIKKVSYKLIYRYRQVNIDDGIPLYVGIRPKTTDGSDGQRFVAMFYPRPSEVWNLIYSYVVLMDKLSTGNPYPYGGMVHSETILSSILSVVEQRADNTRGVYYDNFQMQLAKSIGFDEAKAPDFSGYNHDTSDSREYNNAYNHYFRNDLVTYDGLNPNDF